MRTKRLVVFFLFATVTLCFITNHNTLADDGVTRNQDLRLSASSLAIEDEDGLALEGAALLLVGSEKSGFVISRPIEAPFAFNAVVPHWVSDTPEGTGVAIHLRLGDENAQWGAWQEVQPAADLNLEGDQFTTGHMLFVPDALSTKQYIQVKVALHREQAAAAPKLYELRFTFIDSTAGPTTAELIEMQQAIDALQGNDQAEVAAAADAYPKPFVLSRAIWCTDPACNYTDGLEYQPVTHLILHHTVGVPAGDSAAQLRAYWSYHTYTRGWGDIGYNFVIDLDGNIFEGHLGGDDVVGVHASGANAGSMGLAMIGSYSYAEPSAAVKESIVNMFAWKADQRGIDVFDSSRTLPNMDWGLPHVMGHRDVYGTTECPGTEAHSLLPAIRDEVAKRIGQVSPHVYVDELSSAFEKSSANWYSADSQCGHNGHAYYTWSTSDPAQAVNWGEWRPNVPVAGRYQIEAHVPYCRTLRNETAGAHYSIEHAEGTSEVVISHQSNLGLWASLGEFTLSAGTGNVIHLTDLTTTDDDLGVWFDALRLLPLETVPAAALISPADAAWLNKREVQFSWGIENGEKVVKTLLQVASDAQFEHIVVSQSLEGAVEGSTQLFDADYASLYWRVVLLTESGREFPSSAARFGIDSEPPVSAVKSLAWLEWNEQYKVVWGGVDALNHIAFYTVEYRAAGAGDNVTGWTTWLSGIGGTTAYFSPLDPGQVYEFRSQATDSLGNIEAAHATADISSDQAESFSHAIILPAVFNR